jgi:drug/metabolite transporter (DMT)-like permease
MAEGPRPDATGVTVLLTGALLWSIGSLYSREAVLPKSVLLGIAMEMMCGGVLLVIAGLGIGEGKRVALTAVSLRSFLAFLYLVTFGSLVGFTCYAWLLQVSSPAKVSTYAFVNPVVACFLGWWLGGETVKGRMLLAAAVIVGAVALITLSAAAPSAAFQGEVALAQGVSTARRTKLRPPAS